MRKECHPWKPQVMNFIVSIQCKGHKIYFFGGSDLGVDTYSCAKNATHGNLRSWILSCQSSVGAIKFTFWGESKPGVDTYSCAKNATHGNLRSWILSCQSSVRAIKFTFLGGPIQCWYLLMCTECHPWKPRVMNFIVSIQCKGHKIYFFGGSDLGVDTYSCAQNAPHGNLRSWILSGQSSVGAKFTFWGVRSGCWYLLMCKECHPWKPQVMNFIVSIQCKGHKIYFFGGSDPVLILTHVHRMQPMETSGHEFYWVNPV